MLKQTDIIYLDDHLVAINKPAGLLVHPTAADKSESISAMMLLKNLTGKWVFPIHRIDKATSGVLVFGFSKDAARNLSDLFAAKELKKSYLALVRGYTAESETINYPLKRIFDKMTDRRARRDLPAQDAITHFKRLSTVELPYAVRPHPTARYSLIQAMPETGRLRQIRRHMKHIFHPIVGDHKHGDGHHNRLFLEKFHCIRLLLHSFSLEIAHPFSNETLRLVAPLPEDFSKVLVEIGISGISEFM